MFCEATVRAVETIAVREKLEPAALLAVAEVESGGKAYAVVDGCNEPLIRFYWHYFDRRLEGEEPGTCALPGSAIRRRAPSPIPRHRPRAGGCWRAMPRSNAQAAFETCSYGVGQFMGAHWEWLGLRLRH